MENFEFPILYLKRLILRECSISDTDDLFMLAKDPELTVNLTWESHKTREDTLNFINSIKNDENQITWAICHKESNQIMGIICLRVNRKNSCGELGYWVGVPYWNKGYMTEVVKEVISFSFNNLKLNRVQALHFLSNPASGRVMEKSGMSFEGTLREYILSKEYKDCKMYSVLKREYELLD